VSTPILNRHSATGNGQRGEGGHAHAHTSCGEGGQSFDPGGRKEAGQGFAENKDGGYSAEDSNQDGGESGGSQEIGQGPTDCQSQEEVEQRSPGEQGEPSANEIASDAHQDSGRSRILMFEEFDFLIIEGKDGMIENSKEGGSEKTGKEAGQNPTPRGKRRSGLFWEDGGICNCSHSADQGHGKDKTLQACTLRWRLRFVRIGVQRDPAFTEKMRLRR